MGGKDISDKQKSAAAALIETGQYSYSAIARKLGIGRDSVRRIAQKMEAKEDIFVSKRENCGRKRKTSNRVDRKIVRVALEDRHAPIRKIANAIIEPGVDISERTVRRRLKENQIVCRRPAKKPRLTPRMRQQRLVWARQHQGFTEFDWNRVIFSDECRLEAVTEFHSFVRRRPGERYNEDCVEKRVKHPSAVMLWSCISPKGPGPIYFVEGTMRQDQYKKVLNDVYMPYVKSLPLRPSVYTFMQDGAPCHNTLSIKNYLNSKKINVLPWPGNSPDLNPIENCWSVLKRLVYMRTNNTVAELKKNINDVWTNNLEIKNTITNCYKSMPERCKQVLLAKGGVTKY